LAGPKVAIVTGGSSGIGAAVAERLNADGFIIAVVDRREPEVSLHFFQNVDVAEEASVIDAVQMIRRRYGRIDALVNCAGIARASLTVDTTLASWNEVIGTNLTGTFLFCRETSRIMQGEGGGAIVNIASVDAHAADPQYASYNASKSGILGLTRTLAVELAMMNIRVNSVSPGLVRTPMVIGGSASDPAVRRHLEGDFKRVPLRRLINPSEVASLCAFLISDDASGITGADYLVDGGLLADTYLINSYPGPVS
jgi:NAD(P)-dependent dehydrogenase (short-subunit alcohol dehydrogenase family)